MRVLVVGGGGIGGTVAGHLLSAGVNTTALVTNPLILEALRRHGFRHCGHTPLTQVPAGDLAADYSELSGSYDLVFLAVQPPQVEAAARALKSLLSPQANVVCFQNGLCEQRVARILRPEQVIGGIVTWGASMPEPGVFDRTSSGGFTLGRIDGGTDQALLDVGELLRCVGPVEFTDNLLGARWSKLAANCVVTTLGTLAGAYLGELLQHGFARRLGLEIITEALSVAEAQGIVVEKLLGVVDLRWLRLHGSGPGLALMFKHLGLGVFGLRYRRLRSSMLRAIEKGRPPAVDFLNGEVVSYGAESGIPTPVNARAQSLVWELASGACNPGLETLKRLYDETRQ